MVTATFAEVGIDTKGRVSGQVKTKCPRCDHDRKPAHRHDRPLSVNIDDGVWLCHNCGFTGSLKPEDWQTPIKPERHYDRPQIAAERRLGERARAFLAERAIDPELAIELGVYSNPEDTAIAFPYVRDGEVVHVKYRRIREKAFWSTQNTELVMYGLDECRDADTVVICEGELDRLALMTAGITTVMSVPNGAIQPGANPGAKLDCLHSAEQIIANAKRVVIA
ncbi:MAG TPA: hypothetical protein VFQ54_01575, partial [Thermomicrobiales bacterium]|nr:hypothetical protein [Thermomicrobiales bacterium]